MVDSVATIVAARRMQQDIGRLQQRLSAVGQEVATGRKADVSGELRGRTSILLAFRDAHAVKQHFSFNTDIAGTTHGRVALGLPSDNPTL